METIKNLDYYKDLAERLEEELWETEDRYEDEKACLYQTIQEQNGQLQDLIMENLDQYVAIDDLKDETERKDKTLIRQAATIKQLKQDNSKMDDTIDQMGELITSQRETIKSQDQTIKEMKADIEEYNQMIDELLKEVARLKGWTN